MKIFRNREFESPLKWFPKRLQAAIAFPSRFRIVSQLFGFFVAGLLSVAVDIAVFSALNALSASITVSNVSAACAGLATNFAVNSGVFGQFRSGPRQTLRQILRYSVLAFLSTIYLVVLFELIVRFLDPASASLLGIVRVMIILSGSVIRFILLRLWVFNGRS